jgi:dTDP-4-dehydrorhamnose 3,5-epimerase
MIEGVQIKELKKIADERGSIMHMMKADDKMFTKFGEIYFATAYPGVIKGWHIHKKQEQNYAVIKGMIKLVIYDIRKNSITHGKLEEIFMGDLDYKLVKIPIGVANGWKCIGTDTAILANLSDLPHEVGEMDRIEPFSKEIPYNWNIVFK